MSKVKRCTEMALMQRESDGKFRVVDILHLDLECSEAIQTFSRWKTCEQPDYTHCALRQGYVLEDGEELFPFAWSQPAPRFNSLAGARRDAGATR